MLQSIKQPQSLVWGEGAPKNTFAPSPLLVNRSLDVSGVSALGAEHNGYFILIFHINGV